MTHLSHKKCVGGSVVGEVSGRKLNILLGQDPDDNLFMNPCNQHYVCAYMKKLAQKITPGDVRLRKKVLPELMVLFSAVNVLSYLTLVGKN